MTCTYLSVCLAAKLCQWPCLQVALKLIKGVLLTMPEAASEAAMSD